MKCATSKRWQRRPRLSLWATILKFAHNITFHETLANMKVRVCGDTAVANYTETYDALTRGKRVAKTIITTDTFVKVGGQWKLAAAHSSTVAYP